MFAKLADLLRQNNEYEEAVSVLKKGLKFHPDYPTAHYILAKCYIELNWVDDAVFELTETLKFDKENISAMDLLASLLYKKRELEKALKIYEELLILNPSKRSEFEATIDKIKSELKNRVSETKPEPEPQEESIAEKEEETKEENQQAIEPHSVSMDTSDEGIPGYEGAVARMSGVRELSLDSLDVDVSEKKGGEETGPVESEENKEQVPPEEQKVEEQEVPEAFYTTTMAQVYINQKQYKKAREVLNFLEKKDPFNERVKALIAKLDNAEKESVKTGEKEEEEKSPEEMRKAKALKLSELFETLNKNSKESKEVTEGKKEEEEKKENEEKIPIEEKTPPEEESNKKEMNKFKDWLKGL